MKRLAFLGLVALVLGACGSDGDSTGTTSPATVTTAAVDTTAAATTVTPSSSSTTTVVTTTLPPTTTTVATEDLIKQAVQDYHVAYWSCGQSPSSCDPTYFTAAQGQSRSTVTELANGFVEEGLYFSSDLRGTYLVTESILTRSADEVAVTSCWYDAGVVLGPVGPDGQPTVVNDEVSSIRYDLVLYLEAGQWRVGEQLEIDRLGDGNRCPPVG